MHQHVMRHAPVIGSIGIGTAPTSSTLRVFIPMVHVRPQSLHYQGLLS